MKILITGASTGIGRDMARIFHQNGDELYLVARHEERLSALKSELDGKPHIIPMDLSDEKNCYSLYERLRSENIDILINNAGFGAYGFFSDVPLERELNMIDLNIKALHILTKLFLKDFENKNCGYILNVASSAAFLPGPLMSVYYATKAYVLRLTAAVNEELKKKNSGVYIGALCPGPVETEFNRTAGAAFSVKPLSSHYVADYAIKKMRKRKMLIIPGLSIRLGVFAQRFVPTKLLLKISYNIQNGKKQ